MSAVEEKTGLTGLVTNVAETQAPPGTLIEAENVVVRRPGCIEPRDGLQLVQTLASGFAAYGFSWRTKDFILRNNGANVFDWRDTAGATYRYVDYTAFGTIDPQPMRRDIFSRAEARANLYLPYDAGVLKMATDAGPWVATGTITAAYIIGAAPDTFGTWLANNEQVAYRLVCTKKDANGLVVRTIPSGAVICSNTTGGTRNGRLQLAMGASTVPFFPDTVEVYRTRVFPTSVPPDDEMRLVAVFPAASMPSLYQDLVLPSQLGAVIYTAPSRGGITQQNERPPAAACAGLFRGSMFLANVRGPRKIKISYNFNPTPPAVAPIVGATGIGQRTTTGDVAVGSANILNVASTLGLEKGMRCFANGFIGTAHITNIVGTTVTMSAVSTGTAVGTTLNFFDTIRVDGIWFTADRPSRRIWEDTEGGRLQAYEVTPPEAGYNRTVVIEAMSRGTATRTIQATHGSEYYPPLPNFDGTPLALEQDVWPGAIYWSKPDEPEHVRAIDYAFVGDQNKAILGLIPTRDALFILKEDGVFRLTGANGVWRVDPFDPTARCVLPGSVRALRGRGVFLGDRGVAIVSDESGIELASAAINDLVKPLIDQVLTSWASTGFYELPGMGGAHASCVFERESEYTLARGSTVAPIVYNDLTGAWTTLAYYGHANESLSYKALFNFERTGNCVLSLGVTYYKTLLSTDAGADYLRYDRATAVTVNSYVAPNATLSAPINALEDDVIKDSAGRYWRVTAAVNNSATVPVVLAGGTAAMATGAATLYRSLRCSVIATGFAQPLSAQKRWGSFLTSWTKLVGPVRLRYAYQSSESPAFVEEDARTSISAAGVAAGNGYANYTLGLAPPAQVPRASARAWLLRARVRWAQVHGDTQLEAISAELVPMEPGSPQQVAG
jgi:hypothetical protein